MSLIRSLFERVVDNLRARMRRVELPTQLPRNPEELLKLAEGAVRQLITAPSVGGTVAEVVEGDEASAPAASAHVPSPPAASAPAAATSEAGAANAPTPAREQAEPKTPEAEGNVAARPVAAAAQPTDALERAPSMEIEATKFELGPIARRRVVEVDLDARLAPFPEGYGDARLFLLPRSPHWLLAMWDFTAEQKNAARQAGGVILGLRLFDVADRHAPGRLATETRVDELARSYYVNVAPGTSYVAELGYWRPDGSFVSMGASAEAETPVDAPRPGPVAFATIDYDRPEPAGQAPTLSRPGLSVRSSLTRAVAEAIGLRDLPRAGRRHGRERGDPASRVGAGQPSPAVPPGGAQAGEPQSETLAAAVNAPSSDTNALWGGLSKPGALPTSS